MRWMNSNDLTVAGHIMHQETGCHSSKVLRTQCVHVVTMNAEFEVDPQIHNMHVEIVTDILEHMSNTS